MRPLHALPEVQLQVLQHVSVGQLLAEDGREADGEAVRTALFGQVVKSDQEGEVGIGGSFMEPLFAVRPAASAATVRQVAVEDESKGPFTHHHLST
jgi:hypothetical protein